MLRGFGFILALAVTSGGCGDASGRLERASPPAVAPASPVVSQGELQLRHCAATEDVNLRQSADKNSVSVGVLSEGATVEFIALESATCNSGQGRWLKARQADGDEVFVCDSFLKCDAEESKKVVPQTGEPPQADDAARALAAGVLLSPAPGAPVDASQSLEHTRNLEVSDGLSDADGRRLFLVGMLPQASSKEDFNKAVNAGRAGIAAECAYTTTTVLESAGKRAQVDAVLRHFNKSAGKWWPLTHEIEIELRKLGFRYFLKKAFVAPKGAIGLSSRANRLGSKDHSGHVFTILEDRGPTQDFIADNGKYGQVYPDPSVGFWLPPGIFPKPR